MKIAILNDTHLGIRNSSNVFLDNAEKFYEEIFFPYLLENKIKHILHLGDYYDNRKFVNFRALNRNRQHFLDKLREHKIAMDIIPGNHDTFYKNTNEVNSLKELLGHFMNEINIVMKPTVMKYGSMKIALLPWIANDNREKSLNFIQNCKADWLAGHLELSGFEMMRGIRNQHGMDASLFSRFENVLSGHYHVGSKEQNIHYLGSQMEFFWSDAHDPKGFHVLDTETRELEKIYNPHTLFHRINYDDTDTSFSDFDFSVVDNKFVKIVVYNKSDMFTFDTFVDKIQNRPIHELKIAENFSDFIGDNVDDESISIEDTSVLLDSYIDAVDTDLDKETIKHKMRNLMTEAQALEIL
jgi:DNA repair exonuclease SbcCD nuclease subunit